jgi:CRISPR-associated protein Csb2
VWSPAEAQHGVFDPDMVLLAQEGGARLGLESTLLLTGALRGAILKKVDSEVQNGHRDEIPSWISGHAASGRPVRDQGAHLSLTPLAHVSHPHADGRVLGLALLLPAWLEAEQRSVLRPVLFDEEGRPERITLRMGRVGTATFRQIPIFGETRRALTPETWNAFPSGSTSWASVTPVVLDRFPKRNRRTDRQAWEEEVADVLRTSCESVGLPTPCRVRISTTSLHLGVPRAIPKRRRLRGGSGGSEAQLGTGFPAYPMKGTNASRPQVHVGLEFDEPVLGPMVLGAGRYRGYGFFKPLTGGENRI